ncbi:hypothetical protein B1748_33145 [Paenibacillus sp. MY03]|uniref:ECF transporter S component n=1 Tax=Paenibacillus sp. MY03 TaxID=302980 RepID=UPI000B3C1194|nr:ECF transporter S component [Paenibacillus sp. MY03]OUS68702.1 hypothetical protein B1748_33145 [Paenibacillus sp. MY03]
MSSFAEFIDVKYGSDLNIINQNNDQNYIRELLIQYKDVVLTNIIQQFGLGPIFDIYKRGGNVTTLHNANSAVFANEVDEQRFTKNYSQEMRKKVYEQDFPKNRKNAFQQNEVIKDDYTGKTLPKDGRAHRDHIVSASEIQHNDRARLYMSDQERGAMAVDEKNLAWADSSLNQSKGEHDLITWMNKDNKKDSSVTNAEYYGIDVERARTKHDEARRHVDSSINKAETKYYIKNVTSTGVTQGFAMAQKQAIGLFIYELQEALMIEMKAYFQRYQTLNSIEAKIAGFKEACKKISIHMLAKSKAILISFTDGFISGFIGNLLTVFINTFATTAKNVVRVLNEGVHALIKAVKLLINPLKGISKKEALVEASKIIAVSVTTTLGVILTESFVIYLKTTPFAPFANLIGGVLGGIVTGIVSVTVAYAIDHYAEIISKLSVFMSDLTYDLKVSTAEIREKYYSAIATLDVQYRGILAKIYDEYEELNLLTRNAYDQTLAGEKLAANSVVLARKMKVEEHKILSTTEDVLRFFNN